MKVAQGIILLAIGLAVNGLPIEFEMIKTPFEGTEDFGISDGSWWMKWWTFAKYNPTVLESTTVGVAETTTELSQGLQEINTTTTEVPETTTLNHQPTVSNATTELSHRKPRVAETITTEIPEITTLNRLQKDVESTTTEVSEATTEFVNMTTTAVPTFSRQQNNTESTTIRVSETNTEQNNNEWTIEADVQ